MSTYFRSFPKINYTIDSFGTGETVTDILIRSRIVEAIKKNIDLFSSYTVLDEERPEHVAHRFYGDASLSWVIKIFNEIHDSQFDWPMSQQELQLYCEKVYGKEGMYKVRHYEKNGIIIGEYKEYDYEDPDFIWVPPVNPGPQDPTVYPVSHIEWEERKNEKNREIRIIRNDLIPDLIRQFETLNNG